MNLQPGVLATHDGRIKEGVKQNTVDLQNMNNPALRMARNEYLSLTQQINASITQNITIKAEDKPVKKIDKNKGFIYKRLKRLSQPNNSQLGLIKINSTKIFVLLAQAYFEETNEINKIFQQSIKSQLENTNKGLRSPTDQFNISIYKNNVVGREQQNVGVNFEKLKAEKARERFEIIYWFKIQSTSRKENGFRIKYIANSKKLQVYKL